jgi:hypothetical protein
VSNTDLFLFNNQTEALTYLLTYLLHGAELLEKLTGSAASQEIPRILWNPKVHYRTHKCPPPVPVLCQLHPVPTTPSHFLKMHLNALIIQIYSVIKLSTCFRHLLCPSTGVFYCTFGTGKFHAGFWWPLPSRVRMESHPDSAWKRSS